MKIRMAVLVVLSSIWILTVATAQQPSGKVAGRILDRESGEVIIGASVGIEGTTHGASTDLHGRYVIAALAAGPCAVRVSAVGYVRQLIPIIIESGKTTSVDIALTGEVIQYQEVVITAKTQTSFDGAMLAQQKNAASISDVMSAEQIKRSPDATSGDALRRLTSITLVDNKFVFIRGITDRYNQTTLNGASTTSTDADKKSFSYDLLPSNLLDNTIVVKSATPDLRGDFTGGLVQLTTIDFPDQFLLKASIGAGYNTLTTSKAVLSSPVGKKDWLGIDDGNRSMPPDNQNLAAFARSLSNTWGPSQRTAPMNSTFSLTFGDDIVFGDQDYDASEIGIVGALSYKNSFQRNERYQFDSYASRTNTGTRDDNSVLWGAIANISYRINHLNKISFKNSYLQSGENQYTSAFSVDQGIGLDHLFSISNWRQRGMYSGQIAGEHRFDAYGDLNLEWRAAVSTAEQQNPDRKEISYSRELGNTDASFAIDEGKRSWSTLHDRVRSAELIVTLPVYTMKIKSGILFEQKESQYKIRYFRFYPDYLGGAPTSLTIESLDQIFAQDNFGYGKFMTEEVSKASDTYTGNAPLSAAYAMIDLPFAVFDQRFRFIGGVRWENAFETVVLPRTLNVAGSKEITTLHTVDILPSCNVTYQVNTISNVRLAFSETVNRPEFRELASTGFYDFIKYELVAGNPNLHRSIARNYDLRYEIFLSPGELIAISGFYKRITDAIEEKLEFTATRQRGWFNSERAVNSGWEIEVRKSFGFVTEYLENLTVSGNYSRISSMVEFVDVRQVGPAQYADFQATRPLQGQSPYVINLALNFSEPTTGTSVNVLYNRFGRRMDAVGFLGSDVYEEPRDIVDLSLQQRLMWGMELRFSVKNLNNKARVLTRDNGIYEYTNTGVTYGLQLSTSL